MDRKEVVHGVANELHTTEAAVDAAITQATTLVQSMIGARTMLKLSPTVGADSQAKAMAAIAALSEAREALVACHHELAKDHRRLGLGAYAVGILDKTGDWDAGRPPGVTNLDDHRAA
ncbi:hypothetical protein IP78_08300 [Brevundimonas sp. AAP58]|uniref:hypothetical protein n=1 Tax=Brevundimonas sp. AAP58 TaxID=1523422 RepID=UPI0006B8FD0F|nr:hypothetical protein [Brevundimonas sp. AAP58]KPF79755.1 hypothetical protein IP78_08300 [Brevundimonas sp. AAP58]